jgi:hypothetical protein
MQNARQRVLVPFSIQNGVALSNEVNVGSGIIVGVIAPAAWTAGGLTMQAVVADAGGGATPTYGEVLVDAASTPWAITAITAGAYYGWGVNAALAVAGAGRVRVRSGTSGTPVNQGALRTGFLVILI